jgi:hypothetical protein
LRLIPLAEVAAAGVGHIRGHVHATAGIRTPEAALATRAVGKGHGAGGNGNRAESMTGGVAVAEVLEQMHRRAPATHNAPPAAPDQPGNLSPIPGNRNRLANDPGPSSGAQERGSSSAPAPPGGASGGREDGEEQTMVQQPDGSWEPLRTPDPEAPIPPPPWENPPPSVTGPDDDTAPPPLPAPDPRDGRLFGDDQDAT